MRGFLIGILLLGFSGILSGQNKLEFDGQLSVMGNYAPRAELDFFLGGRYLPELNYTIDLDTLKTLDFEASANISGAMFFQPFDEATTSGDVQPYRVWARYSAKQFEIRLGLQKIDFGSAMLLRPLQWFNQIDPRDPLQLTNGVYGLLGRYYFLNNTNIWLWGLYGNEKTRGFDLIETNHDIPEFGGRIQFPVPKGEVAFSYHHRSANSSTSMFFPQYENIPEDRYGIDAKWDLLVGLWLEGAYVHKSKDLGFATNQILFNVGTDYTFGIGNGLNVVFEHLYYATSGRTFGLDNSRNITASIISYPLGFFDQLSSVLLYDWDSEAFTFLMNYEHQFKYITGYVIAYYNPEFSAGFQQNELVNQFSGPGIRIMVVYNH
jgi:hypothetical protein